MAGIFELKELAARKRALTLESDAYRQHLMSDLHNLQLYGVRLRRKLRLFSTLQSILMFAPILVPLLRRRSRAEEPKPQAKGWRRLFNLGLLGWRLTRQYGPLMRSLLDRVRMGRHGSRAESGERTRAGWL